MTIHTKSTEDLSNYIQSELLQTKAKGVEKSKNSALTGVASLSLPAILALAEEIRHQVSTCPSIMTGVGAAIINVWRRHHIRVIYDI